MLSVTVMCVLCAIIPPNPLKTLFFTTLPILSLVFSLPFFAPLLVCLVILDRSTIEELTNIDQSESQRKNHFTNNELQRDGISFQEFTLDQNENLSTLTS